MTNIVADEFLKSAVKNNLKERPVTESSKLLKNGKRVESIKADSELFRHGPHWYEYPNLFSGVDGK